MKGQNEEAKAGAFAYKVQAHAARNPRFIDRSFSTAFGIM
jgi:hypothetical protein